VCVFACVFACVCMPVCMWCVDVRVGSFVQMSACAWTKDEGAQNARPGGALRCNPAHHDATCQARWRTRDLADPPPTQPTRPHLIRHLCERPNGSGRRVKRATDGRTGDVRNGRGPRTGAKAWHRAEHGHWAGERPNGCKGGAARLHHHRLQHRREVLVSHHVAPAYAAHAQYSAHVPTNGSGSGANQRQRPRANQRQRRRRDRFEGSAEKHRSGPVRSVGSALGADRIRAAGSGAPVSSRYGTHAQRSLSDQPRAYTCSHMAALSLSAVRTWPCAANRVQPSVSYDRRRPVHLGGADRQTDRPLRRKRAVNCVGGTMPPPARAEGAKASCAQNASRAADAARTQRTQPARSARPKGAAARGLGLLFRGGGRRLVVGHGRFAALPKVRDVRRRRRGRVRDGSAARRGGHGSVLVVRRLAAARVQRASCSMHRATCIVQHATCSVQRATHNDSSARTGGSVARGRRPRLRAPAGRKTASRLRHVAMCAVLQRVVLCCNVCCVATCAVLQRVVLCCNVLCCVAMCAVLQRVVLCCNVCCVATCCAVLQCVLCCNVLCCVAMCAVLRAPAGRTTESCLHHVATCRAALAA
jgi:hypothetical protein